MSELFDVDIRTVSYHLREIYESGELRESATLQIIRRVQKEGNREVSREIEYYNLDASMSVGYRVNSVQATHPYLGYSNDQAVRSQRIYA